MSTEEIITDYRNSPYHELIHFLSQRIDQASFTVLVWDQIITFSDEVPFLRVMNVALGNLNEYTGRVHMEGRKGDRWNRYLIPLSFMVNLWAYFRTSWTHSSCAHFVRFEAAMTTFGLTVVALMMFFRVRALYPRSLVVQAILLIILGMQFGVNTWLTSGGIPVPHPAYPLVDCSGEVFRLMLQQGLLYYSVITCISLNFTLMLFLAPPSVKNVLGHGTVGMMSRITIHLKRFANNPNGVIHEDLNLPTALRRRLQPPDQTIPSLAFATRSEAPCSQNVTITLGSIGGAQTMSGNESFAMQTFSTEAAMREEPGPQHPPELSPIASASGGGGSGSDQAEPGTA
ncbi:hypothetical protein BJV74DRAFT_796621 [Russula compacta]|nr:hypothetical protein BJV74DRAFT_796621 [Russula compacta]